MLPALGRCHGPARAVFSTAGFECTQSETTGFQMNGGPVDNLGVLRFIACVVSSARRPRNSTRMTGVLF